MNVRFCLIREGENEKKSTAFAVLFLALPPQTMFATTIVHGFKEGAGVLLLKQPSGLLSISPSCYFVKTILKHLFELRSTDPKTTFWRSLRRRRAGGSLRENRSLPEHPPCQVGTPHGVVCLTTKKALQCTAPPTAVINEGGRERPQRAQAKRSGDGRGSPPRVDEVGEKLREGGTAGG